MKISQIGLVIGLYCILPQPVFGQVEFSSAVKQLKSEPHQWSREQYIADELVELTMTRDNTLVVSYPHRGLNMSCRVNGMLQLSDALLVSLSITNNERRVS